MNVQQYIKTNLQKYYKKKGVKAPPEIDKREFGFGNDKKIDYRHFSFKKEEDLKRHFVENIPLYGSFSAAYYEFPDARPMPKKSFQGADLIFEFDAECNHKTLACSECLEKTKQESIKLIEDFLISDFGFLKKDISVTFSGSRGYHMFVQNKEVLDLSPKARKEIVDYLQARDLDVKKIIRAGATLKSAGWKGRLAKAAYNYAKNSDERRFQDKAHVLEQISKGNYDLFKGPVSFWNDLLKGEVIHLSANIDQTVTLDISRLIRIPSTIHGGSSLLCMYVHNLDQFDPFKDAVVFYNPPIELTLKKDIPELILKDQTFGPFEKNKKIKVPEYLAMYLACKGVVDVIET